MLQKAKEFSPKLSIGIHHGEPRALNRFVLASKNDDEVVTKDGNDEIYGDDGDDYLSGGHGQDYISGGRGRDEMIGGYGADVFAFDGDFGTDRVRDFDAGFDKLQFLVYLPEQRDWTAETILSFAWETDWGVIIDLPDSDERVILHKVSLDELKESDITVKFIETTIENEVIFAGSDDNEVVTGAGNDEVYGEDGADYISGTEGQDYLSGGRGEDTLLGGEDADTFVFDGDFKSDRVEDFDAEIDMLEFILYEPRHIRWSADDILDFATSTEDGVMITLPDSDEDVFLYNTELSDLDDSHINLVHYIEPL